MSEVDPDVVVHAVGLLFDIDSGLANLNLVVSGRYASSSQHGIVISTRDPWSVRSVADIAPVRSKSVPGEKSTYDAITRQTAENALKNTISPVRPKLVDQQQRSPLIHVPPPSLCSRGRMARSSSRRQGGKRKLESCEKDAGA
eukprot:scaffold2945_cov244-Pinguiococcus_pyrenoidosus.AAC.16